MFRSVDPMTMSNQQNRLIILSGPSCVGKGPLHQALAVHYPEFAEQLALLVLYNSRDPRPGERDGVHYHFRSRQEVERLKGRDGFIVMDVRGDLQALEVRTILETIESGRDPFYEGNPFIASQLLKHPRVAEIPRLSIFLSPLSAAEFRYLRDPERNVDLDSLIADIMRRKLLRRTLKQKAILAEPDLRNIERRAGSAMREVQLAWLFDHVIPNHDGEDSENWNAFYHPIGDAFDALQAFAMLLRGEESPLTEQWEEGFPK